MAMRAWLRLSEHGPPMNSHSKWAKKLSIQTFGPFESPPFLTSTSYSVHHSMYLYGSLAGKPTR